MIVITAFRRLVKTAIPLCLMMLFNTSLPAQDAVEAFEYRINTQTSILRVYVGRAGILAEMGHNHVIVNRHIHGMITTDKGGNLQQARLVIPAQQFSIDETGERRRAGNGFESVPTTADRAATRKNMLGPAVLNATGHGDIVVRVDPPPPGPGEIQYPLLLSLAGTDIKLTLPAVSRVTTDRISVEAHFTLNHQQLGLEPFTALGGMLRVAEDIRFELLLEADGMPAGTTMSQPGISTRPVQDR